MTIVEENGTGLANANTYVDPAGAFATSYAEAWLHATEWTDADAGTREKAVVAATRTLDAQYDFRGDPIKPGEQALAWPRYVRCSGISSSAVPVPVKNATMELALALLQRDRTGAAGGATQGVDSINLGNNALAISLASDPAAAPVDSIIPDFIRSMLRDYGDTSGGSMVKVQRR